MGMSSLRGRGIRSCISATLCVALAACGGGGTGNNDTTPPPAPKALTLVAKPDRSYAAMKGAADSTLEVFRDGTTGKVQQVAYTNPATNEQVRVYVDSAGLPSRVVDEKSGRFVVVSTVSAERVDYRAYDAAGKYLSGYAVLSSASGLRAAPIVGTPSISGQLAGQIQGQGQSASFALLPTGNAGLGAEVPFTPAAMALADSLGGLPRPAAMSAHALGAAGIDGRAIIGGLAMGLAVGLGSGAVIPGLVAGAMMAYGLQRILLPVADGVMNANSLEQMSENLNTFLDRFNQGASAETAVSDTLAGRVVDRVKGAVSRAFDTARDTLGSLRNPAGQQQPTSDAPPVDTAVDGFGVDQQGTSYTYSGTMGSTGTLTATGTASVGGDTIRLSATMNGSNLTGTASGRLGSATVSGSESVLGQCAALQQSGGQGTFSYAFDAGATTGNLSFYREAYSIPDGFRVISNGQALYDTGGLVSGNETRMLALNGSRILFVTVNAPNSGTAWELSVGCPS